MCWIAKTHRGKIDCILNSISSSVKLRVLFFTPTFMIYHRALDWYSREQRRVRGQSGAEKSRFAVNKVPSRRCVRDSTLNGSYTLRHSRCIRMPWEFSFSSCAQIESYRVGSTILYLWETESDKFKMTKYETFKSLQSGKRSFNTYRVRQIIDLCFLMRLFKC